MVTFNLISPLNDTRNGTNDADRFFVLGGNDTINALGGNDLIFDQGVLGASGGPLSGDDTFFGGTGNDRFIAGDGINTLNGGSGIDTVSYSFADRGVTANLTTGFGRGEGTDSLFSIENLEGSVNNDSFTGNSGANRLFGDRGRDFLGGGGGADRLLGGVGSDTISGGSGTDTVEYSYLSSVGRVEIRLGNGSNAGTAREFDAAASVNGPVPVAAGTDSVRTIENVVGSAGNDVIVGNSGNNRLSGGAGADRITGGLGADVLIGSAGADRFIFTTLADSSGTLLDRITDLSTADTIDLSAIDANGAALGNGSFVRIGNSAAFTSAGQLRLAFDGVTTRLELNTDADSAAESVILLTGNHTAAAAEDGWLL
jgi:Ca2+-binding RTX toxin-like protein